MLTDLDLDFVGPPIDVRECWVIACYLFLCRECWPLDIFSIPLCDHRCHRSIPFPVTVCYPLKTKQTENNITKPYMITKVIQSAFPTTESPNNGEYWPLLLLYIPSGGHRCHRSIPFPVTVCYPLKMKQTKHNHNKSHIWKRNK